MKFLYLIFLIMCFAFTAAQMVLLAERTLEPRQDSYHFMHLVNASYYGPEVAPLDMQFARHPTKIAYVFVRAKISQKTTKKKKRKNAHAFNQLRKN